MSSTFMSKKRTISMDPVPVFPQRSDPNSVFFLEGRIAFCSRRSDPDPDPKPWFVYNPAHQGPTMHELNQDQLHFLLQD